MSFQTTPFGFSWMFLHVNRQAANDGSDKRRAWCALAVHAKNGSLEIIADRKGFLAIRLNSATIYDREAPPK